MNDDSSIITKKDLNLDIKRRTAAIKIYFSE